MPDPGSSEASRWIEELGFSATPVERARDPRGRRPKNADLRLSGRGQECLVEVKSREPHEDWRTLRGEAEAAGVATTVRRFKLGTLSGKIRDGYEQLQITPCSPGAARLLWFCTKPEDEHFAVAGLERQLLGQRRLLVYEESFFNNLGLDAGQVESPNRIRLCYHYDLNDFERCPLLDGAVVSTAEAITLYLNCYSKAFGSFRTSPIVASIRERGTVVDPRERAEDGTSLLLDADLEGERNKATRSAYLRSKYGVLATELTEESWLQSAATFPLSSSNSDAGKEKGG
jgi:hypothetical protein